MSQVTPLRARIRVWGVRGTCPSPGAQTSRYGGNTPCVEVRSPDGAVLVLDAGTGIRPLGLVLEAEAGHHPVHVVLSHLHGDHVIGLPHFAPLTTHSRSIRISCGSATTAQLRPIVESLFTPPLFPPLTGMTERVSYGEWDATGALTVGAALRVRRFSARHPGQAAVLVVEDDMGPLLAYAPDNELSDHSPDAGVGQWRADLALALRDVPLLMHDATYAYDELAAHVGWGHSTAEEATRFAVACHAGTLLLFHHHPDRTDDELARVVLRCREIARALGSGLRVDAAAEGACIELRAPHVAAV